MKPTEKDLKAMFGQTPDGFVAAMERALAGETPEREKQKKPRRLKRAWSIVLIVALALALTVGAYAAAVRLGITDFIGSYLGYVPQDALDVLQSTEARSWEIGPLTVSLNETFADGYMVYTVWQARTTDGSDALLSQWYDSFYQETPEVLQKRLGLQGGFFGAAAAAYEGPIYSAQVWMELDPELVDGQEGIMDGVYGEDGSMAWVDLVETNPKRIGETLTCSVRIRVTALQISSFTDDGSSSQEQERWEEIVEIQVPVTGVIESRTYLPVTEGDLGYGTVEQIYVERTPAGLYCFVTLRMAEDGDPYGAYNMTFLDQNMEHYPNGMYMSGYIDTDNFPEVLAMHFLSVDEMPESFFLKQGNSTIEFR